MSTDGRYEDAERTDAGPLQDIITGDDAIDDDLAAEEQRSLEAEELGTPDAAQPDSQGDEPLEAELGDDGQGDLTPEDF